MATRSLFIRPQSGGFG